MSDVRTWIVGLGFASVALAACGSDVSVPPPVGAASQDDGTTASAESPGATADETEIVHGVADRGRDPAVIAIDVGGEGLCSGTLIAPQIVLTARHCVSQTTESVACPAESAQIQGNRTASSLGILAGDDISTAKLVAVGKSLVTPVSDVLCDEDIALIVLDRAVTGIKPVGFKTTPPKAGDHVRAVGYGMTGPGSGAGVKLLREHVAIQSVSAAELEVGEATCQGDSGGPALDETTSEVIGVVSRGGPSCEGAGVHNIYTRVDAFLPLIEEAFSRAGETAPAAPSGSSSSGGKGAPKKGSATKPASDMGASCNQGADCASGICVTSTSHHYCSRACGSGDRCPAGYHCTKTSNASASEVCISTAD